jgi:hypothetical protein
MPDGRALAVSTQTQDLAPAIPAFVYLMIHGTQFATVEPTNNVKSPCKELVLFALVPSLALDVLTPILAYPPALTQLVALQTKHGIPFATVVKMFALPVQLMLALFVHLDTPTKDV